MDNESLRMVYLLGEFEPDVVSVFVFEAHRDTCRLKAEVMWTNESDLVN